MENLHHREQHIEADHVGKGRRTNWMVATELHSLVDVLSACIALRKHEEGFIDHRQYDAICLTSSRITSMPFVAATWAIPLPMTPAPMTPIVLTDIELHSYPCVLSG